MEIETDEHKNDQQQHRKHTLYTIKMHDLGGMISIHRSEANRTYILICIFTFMTRCCARCQVGTFACCRVCCKQFSFYSTLFFSHRHRNYPTSPEIKKKKQHFKLATHSIGNFAWKISFDEKCDIIGQSKWKWVCHRSVLLSRLVSHTCPVMPRLHFMLCCIFLRARLVDEAKTRKFFIFIAADSPDLCGARSIIESANSVNWQSSERWRVRKKMSLKSLLKRLTGLKRFDDRSPERLLVFLQFLQFSHLFYTVVVLAGNHWQLDPLNSGQEKAAKELRCLSSCGFFSLSLFCVLCSGQFKLREFNDVRDHYTTQNRIRWRWAASRWLPKPERKRRRRYSKHLE